MRNIILPDLFAGTAYSALTLTGIMNAKVPYTPNFLGSLGDRLYATDGITTNDVALEEKAGAISVLKTAPRGAPPQQAGKEKSQMRKASTVHVPAERSVTADEVQAALNYAAQTGQMQQATLQGILEDQMSGPFGLRAQFELTHEYHRLGGIQGLVLDKDGETLYDWYGFFGLTAPADVAIDFDSFTADGRDFEVQCTAFKRQAVTALAGLPLTRMGLVVLCGDNFFDRVYANKEVVDGRRNRDTGRESDVFGENKAFSTIKYGGITWVNYQGTEDGQVGIDTDEARLFPLDVPGLFQQLFGPPPLFGYTNMKGVPVVTNMPRHRQTDSLAVQEAYSDVLTFCARPNVLRKLTIA